MTYTIRIVCETEKNDPNEKGYGLGWHYYEYTSIDPTTVQVCPDHPTSNTRDRTIVKETV